MVCLSDSLSRDGSELLLRLGRNLLSAHSLLHTASFRPEGGECLSPSAKLRLPCLNAILHLGNFRFGQRNARFERFGGGLDFRKNLLNHLPRFLSSRRRGAVARVLRQPPPQN